MLSGYSGATQVIFTVGDPVAQVTSPIGVTQALRERGRDVIVVPAHVHPEDLRQFLDVVYRMPNVQGVIATVPHKVAAHATCSSMTERARQVGATNVLRRSPDGGWDGDICDGEGYVAALRGVGCDPAGKRALLAGAGGAGSAIAFALLDAGVQSLALTDTDDARREKLLARLRAVAQSRVRSGSPDPFGFDLVINATPMGMRPDDPLPFDTSRLSPDTFVGDVVVLDTPSRLIREARERQCPTLTGNGMFEAVCQRVADFFDTTTARQTR